MLRLIVLHAASAAEGDQPAHHHSLLQSQCEPAQTDSEFSVTSAGSRPDRKTRSVLLPGPPSKRVRTSHAQTADFPGHSLLEGAGNPG